MATVIDLSHVQAAFIFLILVLLREPNVMRICVGSGLLPVSYRSVLHLCQGHGSPEALEGVTDIGGCVFVVL